MKEMTRQKRNYKKIIRTKTPSELNKFTLVTVRSAYEELAEVYNSVMKGEIIMCQRCGDWIRADGFYSSIENITGKTPVCKRCIQKIVEQRTNDNDTPNETKESVQRALRILNRPYIDEMYEKHVKDCQEQLGSIKKSSPFISYLTVISALKPYNSMTYEDSIFKSSDSNNSGFIESINYDDETKEKIKTSMKRFGKGYTDEGYIFLENEYQDWITRYECNTKGQEEVFENLSTYKWLKHLAILTGAPTKDIDAQYQSWMDAGKLKPKQNSSDVMSDSQSLGTLIQKWEETRPLPEIDPELADVDKIGLYIDAFFRGHTAKMLGLKNTFSNIYDKVMNKYKVERPEYNEDDDNEAIFEKVFGSMDDE